MALQQRVLKGFPPNFRDIVNQFPQARARGVIFSYGETVYVNGDTTLPLELRAHEAKHGERQLAIGVAEWWEKYLSDPQFRLEEELIAHKAEVAAHCGGNRAKRGLIKACAKRLSGPLYGSMMSEATALQLLSA